MLIPLAPKCITPKIIPLILRQTLKVSNYTRMIKKYELLQFSEKFLSNIYSMKHQLF